MPNLRNITDSDPEREAWEHDFEDAHDNNLMCRKCGALVPRSRFDVHRQWHGRQASGT